MNTADIMREGRFHMFMRWFTVAIAISAVMYALILGRPADEPTPIPDTPSISLDPAILTATAAIIYDPSLNRILYAKEPELQLPLASLTKLMTAYAALSQSSATSTIPITKSAVMTEGDSGLKHGDRWRLGVLLRYALTVSSNDAMAAVAEAGGNAAFIERMNEDSKTLGLSQSFFLNPTGLDLSSSTSGAYGSARDVAILASALYTKDPGVFESTLQSGKVYRSVEANVGGEATALPILDTPGIIGAKTGYTTLAGGNLVVMFDSTLGHPLVAVVLHSTAQGRFDDMRTLISAARNF